MEFAPAIKLLKQHPKQNMPLILSIVSQQTSFKLFFRTITELILFLLFFLFNCFYFIF